MWNKLIFPIIIWMFLMLKHAQRAFFKDSFELFWFTSNFLWVHEKINVDINQFNDDFVELSYLGLLYTMLYIPGK